MKDYLFNGNKELRKAWEEADAQGKKELEEIDDFITSQPKGWKDQFVSLPKDQAGIFVMESMQEYKHYLEVAKKKLIKILEINYYLVAMKNAKVFIMQQRRNKEDYYLKNLGC